MLVPYAPAGCSTRLRGRSRLPVGTPSAGGVPSGTGIRVEADWPMFDAGTATLFGPLDERSFAYVLPLSRQEAMIGSSSFGPTGLGKDR